MRKLAALVFFISKLGALTALILITVITFIRPTAAYAAATFSLSPATSTVAVGGTLNVDIVLDTGGDAVSGATAIVDYDTGKLQVLDADPTTTGIQIKPGTIFNQSPLTNTVDTTKGEIRYDSGSLGTTYTGRGVMATINFKALAAGTAQVNYVFNPTSTTNTSLVAAATGPTNILATVNNGTYTIGGGSSGGTLPKSGAIEDTLMMLFGGILLLSGGIVLWRRSSAYK